MEQDDRETRRRDNRAWKVTCHQSREVAASSVFHFATTSSTTTIRLVDGKSRSIVIASQCLAEVGRLAQRATADFGTASVRCTQVVASAPSAAETRASPTSRAGQSAAKS